MQPRNTISAAACLLAAALSVSITTRGLASPQTPTYSAASFNGSYSFRICGFAADPAGFLDAIAEAARLTADGIGNVNGSDTVSIDGYLVRRTFYGTYSINGDGTGALVLNPDWGPPIHADMVVGEGGRVAKLVVT